jgi:ATP-binding protein involved in chromosome partitioning
MEEMEKITSEKVIAVLSTVQDPELRKDLVSLGMIGEIKIEGDKISFPITLTTPACPLRNKIEIDARQAVMSIEGVRIVDIDMQAKVKSDVKLQANIDHQIKNVIAVGSGKGGVGKSTISVNLAVSLAQSGAKVGLLDADIYGPNIPMMMGIHQLPPMKKDQRIQPAENYGVKVMSIGFMVQDGQPLIWRGPMLHSAIKQFLTDVDWGDLDYLVVDLPPGTGDVQLSLVQTIPPTGGIIVTTPQAVSFDDAYRALNMFEKLEVPVLGIIENMSYLKMPDGSLIKMFGEGGGLKLAGLSGTQLLGCVPMEQNVRVGGDEGRPIVVAAPNSEASLILKGIAQAVAAAISVKDAE